jgi:hypothetical protein
MSLPRDLRCISLGRLEDQIDCSWTSIDSLDGFLSNVVMLTLKSMQKKQCSAHLIKYLEAFMPNDGHKAQSTKGQTIFVI